MWVACSSLDFSSSSRMRFLWRSKTAREAVSISSRCSSWSDVRHSCRKGGSLGRSCRRPTRMRVPLSCQSPWIFGPPMKPKGGPPHIEWRKVATRLPPMVGSCWVAQWAATNLAETLACASAEERGAGDTSPKRHARSSSAARERPSGSQRPPTRECREHLL